MSYKPHEGTQHRSSQGAILFWTHSAQPSLPSLSRLRGLGLNLSFLWRRESKGSITWSCIYFSPLLGWFLLFAAKHRARNMVKITQEMLAKVPSHTKRSRDETLQHYLRRLTHLYFAEKNIDSIVSPVKYFFRLCHPIVDCQNFQLAITSFICNEPWLDNFPR